MGIGAAVMTSRPDGVGLEASGWCAALRPRHPRTWCRRSLLQLTIHFAAAAGAAVPAIRPGGGGSVTQIGRSKASGEPATPSRL